MEGKNNHFDRFNILFGEFFFSFILSSKIKSKKISNDQELIQSDPISCPKGK